MARLVVDICGGSFYHGVFPPKFLRIVKAFYRNPVVLKPLIICSKWTRMKIAIGVKPDL